MAGSALLRALLLCLIVWFVTRLGVTRLGLRTWLNLRTAESWWSGTCVACLSCSVSECACHMPCMSEDPKLRKALKLS